MSLQSIAAVIAMSVLVIPARAADSPGKAVEARVIVTVADHMNHRPQALHKDDISTTPSLRIASLTPLHGVNQLYILIDDAATDRQLIARALRPPSGSEPANPWCALSGLLAKWPADVTRREVLMIASGMDRPAACANAETAIADAERAGVAVYAIYHPIANYENEEWRKVDAGVVELSHVCYETGGEAYFISHGPMETIVPFLDDIAEHLTNQYLLTVSCDAAPEPGFRDLNLHSASPNLELMAPARVWVGNPER